MDFAEERNVFVKICNVDIIWSGRTLAKAKRNLERNAFSGARNKTALRSCSLIIFCEQLLAHLLRGSKRKKLVNCFRNFR